MCDTTTDYKYYYLEDKICLKECNDYKKNGTYICIRSCLSSNLFYDEDNKQCVSDCSELESEDKKFRKINGHCAGSCDEQDYYNENDFICRVKCPDNQKIDDNYICRENCTTSTNKKYEDENGVCVNITILILSIDAKIIAELNILKEIPVYLHSMKKKLILHLVQLLNL